MRRFADSVQRSCGIGGLGMRFVDHASTHVTRSENSEANAGLIKKGLFVVGTLQMLTSGLSTHPPWFVTGYSLSAEAQLHRYASIRNHIR
jgi:hypothetical protein